jgi:hypothetical protein
MATADIFKPIEERGAPDENGCIDGFCPMPTKPMPVDVVNSPPHYMQGGMEAIDVMEAFSSKEEFVGHLRLTAVKYLLRLNEKDTPSVNARKAKWYVSKLCEELSE